MKKEAALSFLLGDQQDDSVYEDELERFSREPIVGSEVNTIDW